MRPRSIIPRLQVAGAVLVAGGVPVAGAVLLAGTALAAAQAPARRARVDIEHVRGPITARELRRAWRPRRFQACAAELQADSAHLHVRIEARGAVAVDRGRPEGVVPPELACIVDVLEDTDFAPQTEQTEAWVHIFFVPRGVPDPRDRDARAALQRSTNRSSGPRRTVVPVSASVTIRPGSSERQVGGPQASSGNRYGSPAK